MSMYSEKVMEHFRNPRNVGEIPEADGVGEIGNASCGDIMKIYIKVEGDIIEDVKFQTFGCGSAIATSSMVTEMVKGVLAGKTPGSKEMVSPLWASSRAWRRVPGPLSDVLVIRMVDPCGVSVAADGTAIAMDNSRSKASAKVECFMSFLLSANRLTETEPCNAGCEEGMCSIAHARRRVNCASALQIVAGDARPESGGLAGSCDWEGKVKSPRSGSMTNTWRPPGHLRPA